MIVKNIITRNVIIHRGAGEIDNHISGEVIFRLPPSGRMQYTCIYITIPTMISLSSTFVPLSYGVGSTNGNKVSILFK